MFLLFLINKKYGIYNKILDYLMTKNLFVITIKLIIK